MTDSVEHDLVGEKGSVNVKKTNLAVNKTALVLVGIRSDVVLF